MTRSALILSVALATLTLGSSAWASKAPATNRPPGVAANAWVPITGSLGFVIEQQRLASPVVAPGGGGFSAGGVPVPALEGYFVVNRGGRWWRLDSLAGVSLFHTALETRTD